MRFMIVFIFDMSFNMSHLVAGSSMGGSQLPGKEML